MKDQTIKPSSEKGDKKDVIEGEIGVVKTENDRPAPTNPDPPQKV